MKEKTSTVSKRSILLWAARDQFTQFGSSGARIDTILEAAQVNKRHLYELFLTKDGLYMAVLSEVSREIEAAFAAESGFWPREIGALYVSFIDLLCEHREFILLRHWEDLSPTLNGPRIQEAMTGLWAKFEALVCNVLGADPNDEKFKTAVAQARLWSELYAVSSTIISTKRVRDAENSEDARKLANQSDTQKAVYAQIAREIRQCFEDIA